MKLKWWSRKRSSWNLNRARCDEMTCVQIGSHWRSAKFHTKDWSHVRSNCSEENSPMVPNPDFKQYWNNWKNDRSLFSATNQERTLRAAPTTGKIPRKHNGETHCAWAKNKIIIIMIIIIKKKTTGFFPFSFPDPFGLRCQSDSGIAFRGNHYEWKSTFNSQHKDT